MFGIGREGGNICGAGAGAAIGCVVAGKTTGRRIAACINSGDDARIPPICEAMGDTPPILRTMFRAAWDFLAKSFRLFTSPYIVIYLFIRPPRID
jgi:hypothetical protein